jgi:hypothetical protein
MKKQLLVITGNPVEGLFYHGPFEDSDHVSSFIDSECEGTDYWVTEMKMPPPWGYQILENPEGSYWQTRQLGKSLYFKSIDEALANAWQHYERESTHMGSMSREQREHTAQKLINLGEFAARLYGTWQHADSSNRAAIEKAFDHLFQKADREY